MFGKLMNNYYYGKSGKGDYRKEDLPKNRWQLFWEMLRVRFSGLIRLNLVYMIAWLPTILVIMFSVLGWFNALTEFNGRTEILTMVASGQTIEEVLTIEGMEDFYQGALDNSSEAFMTGLNQVQALAAGGQDTTEAVEAANETAVFDFTGLQQSIITMGLLFLVPCILITGPFTAGVSYVTRNWARDEHAFVWSDFKDAVKANWKQGLAISAITSFLPLIMYLCWDFYGQLAEQNWLFVVPQVLALMVGLIWFLSVIYFYPLMVTYKLRFRDLIKNGVLLAIARLPFSVGLRLLSFVPVFLGFFVIFFFGQIQWVMLFEFLYYILLGYSLSRFIYASYSNAVFDRFINPRIAGVEVNRGLSDEEDDYDDEDDSENN